MNLPLKSKRPPRRKDPKQVTELQILPVKIKEEISSPKTNCLINRDENCKRIMNHHQDLKPEKEVYIENYILMHVYHKDLQVFSTFLILLLINVLFIYIYLHKLINIINLYIQQFLQNIFLLFVRHFNKKLYKKR